MDLSICGSLDRSICLSIDLSIYRSINLSIYLSIYIYLCIYVSIYLSIDRSIDLSAIQQDFLIFCTWQHQKRSTLRDFLFPLNFTTSKTKQFCETSFKNGKFSAELTASYQCVFAIFPVHLSKLLRLPRKSDARWYDLLHLSRNIFWANLKIWCSKMQPLSGNQRPDLLTALMNMSLFADPLQMSHAYHRFWKCYKTLTFWSLLTRCTTPCACHAKRHLNVQKWCEHVVFLTFWLRNVLRATAACTFSTSQFPKVVREWCVFYILTSKCASRHNGVHFFDISTSKSGPRMVCFAHFGFEMCFAPQQRALFRHLNFQKCCEDLWSVLSILTCKCAWHHNGVQFFISHLASWLRTRRSSEPTFRASGASNHWKNTVNRDFPTFSGTCIFFLLTLSLLGSSLFCSSLLFFDSYHLCFSSVQIVGSLTSKLPSTTTTTTTTTTTIAALQLQHYNYHTTTTTVQLHYTTPHYTALQLQHATLHYTALVHSKLQLKLHLHLQLQMQLQLRYTTPDYNYNYNYTATTTTSATTSTTTSTTTTTSTSATTATSATATATTAATATTLQHYNATKLQCYNATTP